MAEVSFFGSTPRKNSFPISAIPQKRASINVGEKGDCGYRAIACGIIENLCTNNPPGHQQALTKIYELHRELFPPKDMKEKALAPLAWINHMVADPKSRAKFIRDLAFTLRQISVDEVGVNPGKYCGAFVNNISLEQMRKYDTWVDKTVLAALADSLAIPLKIHLVETNKKGARVLSYGKKEYPEYNDAVVIQLQADHYTPKLRKASYFEMVAANQLAPTPEAVAKKPDPELNAILEDIGQNRKNIQNLYETNLGILTGMLVEEQTDKEKLLTVYIATIGHNAHNNYVGVEHGSQDFFNNVVKPAEAISTQMRFTTDQRDRVVLGELIHALARDISVGRLDKDFIFAELEQPSVKLSMR